MGPRYKIGSIIQLTNGDFVEVVPGYSCHNCIFSYNSSYAKYRDCRSARYHLLPGHKDMNCYGETLPKKGCVFKLIESGI